MCNLCFLVRHKWRARIRFYDNDLCGCTVFIVLSCFHFQLSTRSPHFRHPLWNVINWPRGHGIILHGRTLVTPSASSGSLIGHPWVYLTIAKCESRVPKTKYQRPYRIPLCVKVGLCCQCHFHHILFGTDDPYTAGPVVVSYITASVLSISHISPILQWPLCCNVICSDVGRCAGRRPFRSTPKLIFLFFFFPVQTIGNYL